jgi:hypothetical protein
MACEKRVTPSCHTGICRHVSTAQAVSTTPATAADPRTGASTHVTAMSRPIIGRYMYRSAIDCMPVCTMPITGSRVTRYHSQPNVLARERSAAHVIAARMTAAITSARGAIAAGIG